MKMPEAIPPKRFLRFFRWFCHPKLRSYIEGDLMELYNERLKESGKRKADIRFIIDVMLLFRPGIIRPAQPYHTLNNFAMLKSYFKIGWRNLLKNKGYSVINISGLALGLAVAGIIALWVFDELSFNQSHENYPRITQIMKGGSFEGKFYVGQRHLPYPLIEELSKSYADNFKHIVPMHASGDHILSIGDKIISARGSYVGAGAPEMFTFKMIYGNWSGLQQQQSIMISQSTARALFGRADPMDEDVTIGNSQHVKVTGVFEDFPKNSSLYGTKFFAPWELHLTHNPWIKEQGWENHFLFIYAEIQSNRTLAQVSENIKEAEVKAIQGIEHLKGELTYNPVVMLHPMHDWHLRSSFKEGVLQTAPAQFVLYMSIIGGFVLLLACINFMNLSTARSEKRAKEVGIRKTMGSVKSQLINQFFSESFLVVILAFLAAIIIVTFSLPFFNDFSGKAIVIPYNNAGFWIITLSIILVTGFLAGSYPALYLSSFNAVKVLKGTFHAGRMATVPRKFLVVLQFSISITLIICTIIVYNQINHAKNRTVGYQREGLLMIQKKSEAFFKQMNVITTALKSTGVVTEVSESAGQVTEVWSGNGGFTWRGMEGTASESMNTLTVSHDFGRTVGWSFIDGRDFSKDIASDSSGFVINEAAAKLTNLKNPVGEIIHWRNTAFNVDKDFRILGVIKNMVMESPFDPVEPAVYFVEGWKGWINIRINPSVSVAEALPKIEAVFKSVIPSAPFDYKFADEQFARKFEAEEKIGKLSAVFSSLAIFISCLGLFGLSSFVAEQRTKELGIRKVLGASIPQLWKLLSKDFVLLVVIACLLAIPLSFVFMQDWLTQFQYRTTITWHIFVIVALGAILITIATVSYQSIKAAVTNPINSLRSE